MGSNRLQRPAEIRRRISDPSLEKRQLKRGQQMKERDALARNSAQTFLEQAAVSQRTATDYRFRMDIFNQFCKMNRLSTRSAKSMDDHLAAFFEQCFRDGMDLGKVTKFLAAVQDSRPELAARQMLPRARRTLQGWKNLDPGVSRPPLAWPLVALLAKKMLDNQQVEAAMFTLTMFATYIAVHSNFFDWERRILCKQQPWASDGLW